MRLLMCFLLVSSPLFALSIGSVLPASLPVMLMTTEGEKGRQIKFEDLFKDKKGVAIVFVAVQCPYSRAYNKRYIALAAKLKEKNVAFVPVNSNVTEPWDKVKQHAEAAEQGYTFPIFKDQGAKLADLVGAHRTPEAFLFDAKKKLLYHGRIDNDAEGNNPKRSEDLLNAVDQMTSVPFKGISVAETKFFGCTIKRK